MRILVTGGAGFIGSNFVHHVMEQHPGTEVVVLDKLTYAGNLENLAPVADQPGYRFIKGDICDPVKVREAMEGCDVVLNFAAESHVDRSIENPGAFVQTDVYGAYVLLEAAKEFKVGRFVQISTDEVYGSLGDTGMFTEQTRYDPSSPYSASKATMVSWMSSRATALARLWSEIRRSANMPTAMAAPVMAPHGPPL